MTRKLRPNKLFALFISFAVAFAFMPGMTSLSYADDEWFLSEEKVTIDTYCEYYYLKGAPANDEDDIMYLKDAKSSNSKIVSIDDVYGDEDYGYGEDSTVTLVPKGVGTASVTITNNKGQTNTIQVTVTKNWLKGGMKQDTDSYFHYGDNFVSVRSLPNTKVTIKIGKKKFKGTTKKNGRCNIKVKLKKTPKIGTKYTATFTNSGIKITLKRKVACDNISDDYIFSIEGKKKNLKIELMDHHKGDILTVKVNGQTLKKKIKKVSKNRYVAKFKTKKKIKGNATVKVTLKNKYKQKLFSGTYKLYKGYWEIY